MKCSDSYYMSFLETLPMLFAAAVVAFAVAAADIFIAATNV